MDNEWLANATAGSFFNSGDTAHSGNQSSFALNGDDVLSGGAGDSIVSATIAAAVATVATSTDPDPAFVRFRDESRFWVQRVLLPIVGTIGVFGNGATILVLTRRGMRSSTNAYLTALAIADLVYLLCVFWLSLRHYPHIREDLSLANFYAYTWPYSLWLTDATTNTSVWLTVTFTVERYIAVCHPIRGRLLCTESRARRVIVAVYVICFTATLSTPFEWTVLEITDPVTNVTKAEIMPSHLGNDETYQTVYYWFTSISFVLLPLTLLIIFNSFLIQSVRQSRKLRQVMTQRQTIIGSDREERAATNEIRITVTLIAVVIMFLVCQLPTAATLIYKIFHDPTPHSNEEAVLRALGNIFNCLVSVNAACNFLLYCALSDKYRRTFMWTFCRCLYRPASPVHSMAFFTQVDDYGNVHGHHHHHNNHLNHHNRQASVHGNSNRFVAGRPTSTQQHRSSTGSAHASSYLALPDRNGSLTGQNITANQRQRPSSSSNRQCRSSSLQSTNHIQSGAHEPSASLMTAVLDSKVVAAATDRSPDQHQQQRWSKCWPWSSTKRTQGKAGNILIKISDAEDPSVDLLRREPNNSQHSQRVNEEEVAFV